MNKINIYLERKKAKLKESINITLVLLIMVVFPLVKPCGFWKIYDCEIGGQRSSSIRWCLLQMPTYFTCLCIGKQKKAYLEIFELFHISLPFCKADAVFLVICLPGRNEKDSSELGIQKCSGKGNAIHTLPSNLCKSAFRSRITEWSTG